MEPARCQICNKPVINWLEICNQLCVCTKCASTVTLSDLSGIGYAKVKPDTFEMDGETLVTKEEPEEVINYSDVIKAYRERGMIVSGEYTQGASYGMRVDNGNKTPKLVQVEVKPLSPEEERNVIGSILKSGDIPDGPMGRADIAYTLKQSYSWTIDEIVQYIRDFGFATEAAFNAHCSALVEGGYTEETAYALILYARYNEQTVCDEIGTHYNALEGQTPEEAIDDMLAACRVEDALLTEEQKAKLDTNAECGKAVMDSLVTKDSDD